MSGAYSSAFSNAYDIGTPVPPPGPPNAMGSGSRHWPVERVPRFAPYRMVPEPRRFDPPLVVQRYATLVPQQESAQNKVPPRPIDYRQADQDFLEAYLLGE